LCRYIFTFISDFFFYFLLVASTAEETRASDNCPPRYGTYCANQSVLAASSEEKTRYKRRQSLRPDFAEMDYQQYALMRMALANGTKLPSDMLQTEDPSIPARWSSQTSLG
jgi:hypothetical protein